jgi:hypothetical protein
MMGPITYCKGHIAPCRSWVSVALEVSTEAYLPFDPEL